jgi:hypothetical protein
MRVKLSGVWLPGWLPCQLTARWLNHVPLAESFTVDRVTATG